MEQTPPFKADNNVERTISSPAIKPDCGFQSQLKLQENSRNTNRLLRIVVGEKVIFADDVTATRRPQKDPILFPAQRATTSRCISLGAAPLRTHRPAVLPTLGDTYQW